MLGYNPKIILAGRKLNDSMAEYVFSNLKKILKKENFKKKNLKILILGITFKENCPDIRNSQSLKLTNFIKKNIIKFTYTIKLQILRILMIRKLFI